MVFRLLFHVAWHFPDELLRRTPAISSDKRASALVERRWGRFGTPTAQPSLNPLGCSWGPSDDPEGSFNTIKLHSSLSTRWKVKGARGSHLWLTLRPRQVPPVGPGTQMSQTHPCPGVSPLVGETDVCQGHCYLALTLHLPHTCLHTLVYNCKMGGGVGFHSGRRGQTWTGVLTRARGQSQKFPTLLSTYYVPGRVWSSVWRPEMDTIWEPSLRRKNTKRYNIKYKREYFFGMRKEITNMYTFLKADKYHKHHWIQKNNIFLKCQKYPLWHFFSYNFGLHTLYLPPHFTNNFCSIFCRKTRKRIPSFLLPDWLKLVCYYW